MSQDNEVEISGLDQVLDNLRKLDEKVQGKVLKKAVDAGAKVILTTSEGAGAKHNRTGRMMANLKIRRASQPKKGIFRASVGFAQKDYVGDVFYAGFVIWDHLQGSRKLGSKRKLIKGDNFLKASAAQAGASAASAMIDTIRSGIEEA